MAKGSVWLLAFSLLLPHLGFADDLLPDNWSITGSIKSLNIAFEEPPRSFLEDGFLSSNRFRLEALGQLPAGLETEIAIEHLVLAVDPKGQLPLPRDLASRRIDLEHNWNENGSVAQQFQVDRLSLQGSIEDWEWKVGRQAIGFGRISLSPPLDIIAPFPPDSLDTTVRPGIDALRISRYFGLAGQVDLIGVLGQTGEQNSLLTTLTYNTAGVDLLALGGRLLGREVIGGGAAGQIGGAGLKGEVVWYNGKEDDLNDRFVIAAVETDFQFTPVLTVFAEYLFNGAGAEQPADYPAATNSAMVQEGLSFLLGQQYLLFGPSLRVHPLATVNLLLIANLEDGSQLVRPLIDLSLSDNLSLQVFYTFNWGDEPDNFLTPRSEFGQSGDSGGLFLRYFF